MRLPNSHASDGASRNKSADDTAEQPQARTTGRSVTKRQSNSDSDDEDDSSSDEEFGFLMNKRNHTLTSFVAYAEWAKQLHFGGPPPSNSIPNSRCTKPAAATPATKKLKAEPKAESAGKPSMPAPSQLASGSQPTKASPARAAGGDATAGRQDSDEEGSSCSNATAVGVEQIEAEFWRVVERPVDGYMVETQYGQDLDSGRWVLCLLSLNLLCNYQLLFSVDDDYHAS